jgi:hypothetical protein
MQSEVTFYESGTDVRCIVNGRMSGVIYRNTFGGFSYSKISKYNPSNKSLSVINIEIVRLNRLCIKN